VGGVGDYQSAVPLVPERRVVGSPDIGEDVGVDHHRGSEEEVVVGEGRSPEDAREILRGRVTRHAEVVVLALMKTSAKRWAAGRHAAVTITSRTNNATSGVRLRVMRLPRFSARSGAGRDAASASTT